MRPEDLIVYKLISYRTRDRVDIEAVVQAMFARGEDLDWAHIQQHAAAFGVQNRIAWARSLDRDLEEDGRRGL